MKYYRSFFILVSCFLCVSCSSDNDTDTQEPPEMEESDSGLFFNLSIAADFDTSQSDDWVIIHNDNGDLLGLSPYEQGQDLVFQADANSQGNSLTITLFQVTLNNGNTTHTLNSLTNIPLGSVWRFENAPETPVSRRDAAIGSFNVTTTGIPNFVTASVSNSDGPIGGGGSSTGINGIFIHTRNGLSLFTNNDYFLSVSSSSEGTRYIILDDVQNEDNLTVGYSDFISPINTTFIDINPEISYNIFQQAFRQDEELTRNGGFYIQNTLFTQGFELPAAVLELDGFDRYVTQLFFQTDSYSYNYTQFNTLPTNITVPSQSPEITIANDAINTFGYTTNLSGFSRQRGAWTRSSGTFNTDFMQTIWFVHSANTGQGNLTQSTIGEIPPLIQETYPNLFIDEVSYNGISFYYRSGPYEGFINRNYVNPSTRNPFISEEVVRFTP